MPFVKPSCEAIKAAAQQRGFVRSKEGRIHHVPLDGGVYKVVNYLIQGSAAGVMKQGLKNAWDAGVFDVLHPHLTIHDEIVFSIPQTLEGVQACEELKYQLLKPGEQFNLKVPLRIDTEIGEDWGHCENDNYIKLKERFGVK